MVVADTDWSIGLVKTIAKRVQDLRKQRGMIAQDLADKVTALGYPLNRATLAGFEAGRRTSINLPEFLALAAALNVPPAELIAPQGTGEPIELLPGQQTEDWAALRWLCGDDAQSLELLRKHDKYVQDWRTDQQTVTELRQKANGVTSVQPTNERAALLNKTAADYEKAAELAAMALGAYRQSMRAQGLVPPMLPPGLEFVDRDFAAGSRGGDPPESAE